jgi:hypothetical protein
MGDERRASKISSLERASLAERKASVVSAAEEVAISGLQLGLPMDDETASSIAPAQHRESMTSLGMSQSQPQLHLPGRRASDAAAAMVRAARDASAGVSRTQS